MKRSWGACIGLGFLLALATVAVLSVLLFVGRDTFGASGPVGVVAWVVWALVLRAIPKRTAGGSP